MPEATLRHPSLLSASRGHADALTPIRRRACLNRTIWHRRSSRRYQGLKSGSRVGIPRRFHHFCCCRLRQDQPALKLPPDPAPRLHFISVLTTASTRAGDISYRVCRSVPLSNNVFAAKAAAVQPRTVAIGAGDAIFNSTIIQVFRGSSTCFHQSRIIDTAAS